MYYLVHLIPTTILKSDLHHRSKPSIHHIIYHLHRPLDWMTRSALHFPSANSPRFLSPSVTLTHSSVGPIQSEVEGNAVSPTRRLHHVSSTSLAAMPPSHRLFYSPILIASTQLHRLTEAFLRWGQAPPRTPTAPMAAATASSTSPLRWRTSTSEAISSPTSTAPPPSPVLGTPLRP